MWARQNTVEQRVLRQAGAGSRPSMTVTVSVDVLNRRWVIQQLVAAGIC